tara:strand:- start:2284 stop:2457 length:174 start_codon:yes stop_codon:yes gene_type:complete
MNKIKTMGMDYTDRRGLVSFLKVQGLSVKDYRKLSPALKKQILTNYSSAAKAGEVPF